MRDNAADPNVHIDMDLDMDNFWIPQSDVPQPFGTREAPSMLMNWYTMGSPFGRTLRPHLLQRQPAYH